MDPAPARLGPTSGIAPTRNAARAPPMPHPDCGRCRSDLGPRGWGQWHHPYSAMRRRWARPSHRRRHHRAVSRRRSACVGSGMVRAILRVVRGGAARRAAMAPPTRWTQRGRLATNPSPGYAATRLRRSPGHRHCRRHLLHPTRVPPGLAPRLRHPTRVGLASVTTLASMATLASAATLASVVTLAVRGCAAGDPTKRSVETKARRRRRDRVHPWPVAQRRR